MRYARILYNEYMDSNHKMTIGGTQTYIDCLAGILISIGIKPVVYQYSTENFVEEYHGYTVIGVAKAHTSKELIHYIDVHEHDYKSDILIFGTDFLICNNKFRKTVAIQHGIAWDITKHKPVSNIENYTAMFKNLLRVAKKYKRFQNCKYLVCVDYNFINWYRTQVAYVNTNYFVIPNFAKVLQGDRKNRDCVSVVFARRLIEYRGTKLFTEAIAPLLESNKFLHVTIAGTGPDEMWMKERLSKYPNVNFTTFKAEDSIDFHSNFDIAVVPTTGSEGTSLSLLEAMSAGCAVIATNVGGMTNIILDGYNGIMIKPEVEELRDALTTLIENKKLRDYISKNAQETVRESFSFEKWKNSWIKVIESIEKE